MPVTPETAPPASGPKRRRKIQFICDLYIPEVHGGVVDYARSAGWSLYDGKCYIPSFTTTEHWDGMLTVVVLPELAEWLKGQPCPIVRLVCTELALPYPAVEQDCVAIGALGARHFLTLGSPTIAFYRVGWTGETERMWEGFSSTLAAAGKKAHLLDISAVIQKTKERTLPRPVRWAWLRDRLVALPRPLAVMVEDDRFALDLFEAAEMLGWRIPEDLAVLGTDDRVLVHGKLPVPLSSVDSNLRGIGWAGAALLDRLLDGEPAPDEPIIVAPGQVAVRRSTAAFTCDHPGVSAAVNYLRAHFAETVKLSTVAKAVGCSERSLQTAFRQRVGRTISDELAQLRLSHAARLLRETDLKLESVAQEAGFRRASYLCEVFRPAFGETPAEYRQSQRA